MNVIQRGIVVIFSRHKVSKQGFIRLLICFKITECLAACPDIIGKYRQYCLLVSSKEFRSTHYSRRELLVGWFCLPGMCRKIPPSLYVELM